MLSSNEHKIVGTTVLSKLTNQHSPIPSTMQLPISKKNTENILLMDMQFTSYKANAPRPTFRARNTFRQNNTAGEKPQKC